MRKFFIIFYIISINLISENLSWNFTEELPFYDQFLGASIDGCGFYVVKKNNFYYDTEKRAFIEKKPYPDVGVRFDPLTFFALLYIKIKFIFQVA